MKKTLKVLGVIVLVLLAALIALPFVFKDKIAEKIQSTANETLNAELAFEDLSLSLVSNFPNATLELDQLTIDGVDQFQDVRLIQLGKLTATIDVMSLFGETINIQNISLQNGDIDVRVLKDGTANYDLVKSSATEEQEESPEEESDGAFAMNLQGYSIVNTNIKYTDESAPMVAVIEQLNHSGSGDFTADRTKLETATSMESFDLLYDGVRFLKESAVKMDINLDLDLANMHFVFAENTVAINDLALAIDGFIKMPTEDMEMDINYSATETDFKSLLSLVPAEFASDLTGVDADGTMSFAGFIKGIFGPSSLPGFGLDVTINDGRFNYPDLPKSVENIQLKASVDASNGNNLDAAVLDVDRFYMEMAGNPVDLHLRLSQPLSDPNIDCKLQAKVVLDNLRDVIPLAENETISGSINADLLLNGQLSTIEREDYENFDAQGQIILQELMFRSSEFMYPMDVDVAYLSFTPKQLSLTQFKGNIGQSDISANGKMDNYLAFALKDALLKGEFNMSSDLLDLNELMGEDTAAAETEETEADTTAVELLEVPGNIDFMLKSSFDKVLYDDVVIENVKGNIAIKDHVADLQNVEMDVLKGHVILDGSYSTFDPNEPKIDLAYDIQRLDIAQTAEKFNTVEKLAPIAASCDGAFSTDLRLASSLDNKMELVETSMNGRGTMSTHSVTIDKFVPLTKLADQLGMSKLANPTISDVNLSYKIEDGKAIIDPFVVKLDGIETEIAGSTSLISEDIDYTMKMDVPFEKIPSNLVGQASSWIGQLNTQLGTNLSVGDEIPVNIRVTGTIDNPKFATAYGDVAEGEAPTITEQVVDEVKEQVQEVIDDTKDKAREEAQAQADKLMEDARNEADKLVEQGKKSADQVRNSAYAEADKLENKGANFIEKSANKLAATTMRKEADKAYDKAVLEAEKQGEKLVSEAQKEADALLENVD